MRKYNIFLSLLFISRFACGMAQQKDNERPVQLVNAQQFHDFFASRAEGQAYGNEHNARWTYVSQLYIMPGNIERKMVVATKEWSSYGFKFQEINRYIGSLNDNDSFEMALEQTLPQTCVGYPCKQKIETIGRVLKSGICCRKKK